MDWVECEPTASAVAFSGYPALYYFYPKVRDIEENNCSNPTQSICSLHVPQPLLSTKVLRKLAKAVKTKFWDIKNLVKTSLHVISKALQEGFRFLFPV
jgi:hypothetical protein